MTAKSRVCRKCGKISWGFTCRKCFRETRKQSCVVRKFWKKIITAKY